jgi:hypothetical protein
MENFSLQKKKSPPKIEYSVKNIVDEFKNSKNVSLHFSGLNNIPRAKSECVHVNLIVNIFFRRITVTVDKKKHRNITRSKVNLSNMVWGLSFRTLNLIFFKQLNMDCIDCI